MLFVALVLRMKGEISRIFGKQTLVYIKRIVENGHFDILSRMPETILVKILSFLHLEDIAKLSQVSKTFREVLFFCMFLILILFV